MNNAQQELIESLFGEYGDYTETILEPQETPKTICVFYLYRAINESTGRFLISLDKLYNPELSGNLETIRCLRIINDLVNNAEMKNAQFGVVSGLNHFFSRLGDTKDPNNFITEIKKLVTTNIKRVIDRDESLLEKAHLRYLIEPYISPTDAWREIIDLPQAQLSVRARYSPQKLFASVKTFVTDVFDVFEAFVNTMKPPQDWDEEQEEANTNSL